MAYDYKRIENITFKSLKDGKLQKDDILIMIEFYEKKEDYDYCHALKKAWIRYETVDEKTKKIWKYLANSIN